MIIPINIIVLLTLTLTAWAHPPVWSLYHVKQHIAQRNWRLIGTTDSPTQCHKALRRQVGTFIRTNLSTATLIETTVISDILAVSPVRKETVVDYHYWLCTPDHMHSPGESD